MSLSDADPLRKFCETFRSVLSHGLKAESEQRERAEHEFAMGLLNPIGITGQTNVPELRSYYAWSAVKQPSLKLRVLATAFEQPESAARVARRADWVMQSCVGLSPDRRRRAIQILSAKQRDTVADPRVRAAACRVALELGSTDLPAWAESCSFFSKAKEGAGDDLDDFLTASLGLAESRNVWHERLDQLLTILDRSSRAANDEKRSMTVSNAMCSALGRLIFRLDKYDAARVVDVLIAALRERNSGAAAALHLIGSASRESEAQAARIWDALFGKLDPGLLSIARPERLRPIVQRLEMEHVDHAAESLIAALDRDTYRCLYGLGALAPRLTPAQADRAWDAIFRVKAFTSDEYYTEALKLLATRLSPQQARACADNTIITLEKAKDPENPQLEQALDGLSALSGQLDAAQVKRAAVACIALQKDGARGLAALATRLDSEQFSTAWPVLVEAFRNAQQFNVGGRMRDSAGTLPTAEVPRVLNTLLALVESPKSSDASRLLALYGVDGIGPRIPSSDTARTLRALVGVVIRPDISNKERTQENLELDSAATNALKPIAERVTPDQAAEAFFVLIDALRVRTGQFPESLGLLARRLDSTRVKAAADLLLAHATDPASAYGRTGLTYIAPRLSIPQAERAWHLLSTAMVENAENGDVGSEIAPALDVLAARLDGHCRDEMLIKTTTAFLEHGCSITISFVSALSSPREVARLLSHPACVGDLRERLLRRFEELVLHGGKPVFEREASWKPFQDVDGDAQGPSRRFQTIYDASAWIQVHWPDFDLESNYPATWRGSH